MVVLQKSRQEMAHPSFMGQIVLAVLRGEQSVAELVRQHGVAESLFHKWRTQFLKAGRVRVPSRKAPVWGVPTSLATTSITGSKPSSRKTSG